MARKQRGMISAASVWTEMNTYIKGSADALLSGHKGRLSEKEYLALPRKASSFGSLGDSDMRWHRESVYRMYELYETAKEKAGCHDVGDLVFHLYSQLQRHGYNGPVIDHLFVDEIQDLTAAMVIVLSMIVKDANRIFLSGDSAQTIARGVGFR
jgi:superfamily I DNA/RNA helicase